MNEYVCKLLNNALEIKNGARSTTDHKSKIIKQNARGENKECGIGLENIRTIKLTLKRDRKAEIYYRIR